MHSPAHGVLIPFQDVSDVCSGCLPAPLCWPIWSSAMPRQGRQWQGRDQSCRTIVVTLFSAMGGSIFHSRAPTLWGYQDFVVLSCWEDDVCCSAASIGLKHCISCQWLPLLGFCSYLCPACVAKGAQMAFIACRAFPFIWMSLLDAVSFCSLVSS